MLHCRIWMGMELVTNCYNSGVDTDGCRSDNGYMVAHPSAIPRCGFFKHTRRLKMAQANGTAIAMEDGRTVVFGTRTKAKKEIISDSEVRFDFTTGRSALFDMRKVNPETARMLGLHGAKQKIGDEGSDADTSESYEAECRAMIERLYVGTAFERQGGGGGFQDTVLIEALVEASAQTRDEVVATLKTMSADEKLALRQIPEVASAIKVIEARKSAGVDAAALKAKFGF